jgi:chromosome partitioning protein
MDDTSPAGQDPQLPEIAHPDFEPRRSTPWNTLEGRVISLISRKGGVGKTTSAVNLGAALALSGHTVLVIGTDPQCGICRSLGQKPLEMSTCLTEIFTDNRALTDLAQPSPLPDLFFVSPRILTLEQEENYLEALEDGVHDFLREVDRARHLFDTILIDCPPHLGPPTRAALLASDSYLVPLQAEELCRESVASLLEFVDSFRERNYQSLAKDTAGNIRPIASAQRESSPLSLEGIFLTMASAHTRMGRHVADSVQEEFGDLVFQTSVPRTTRLSEMALRGKPAVIYDRRSPGSRAYFDLADEIVRNYCESDRVMGLAEGDGIPDRIDPLANGTAEDSGPGPDDGLGDRFASGGIDRFLAEMSRGDTGYRKQKSDGATGPEIVSLDDLLAEEEVRGGKDKTDDDWDEGFWSMDADDRDRLN